MMKRCKKPLSLVLALLLVGSGLLAGCSSENAAPVTTEAGKGQDSPMTEAETLPEPSCDFGGADYRMLLREEFTYEFDVTEATGDVVEDAVYERNRTVSEELNVTVSTVAVPGGYSAKDTFLGTARSSVLADDRAFDLIAGAANYSMTLGAEGLALNLLEVDGLDLSQPWWSDGFTKSMTIGNSLYYGTGSISLNSLENMIVFMFNKKLCKDFDLEEPYASVKNGTWTFEKLMEMANTVSGDLNGDGKRDKGDMYGYLLYTNTVKTMLIGFDVPMTTRNADGSLEMSFLNDRTVKIVESVSAAVRDNPSVYYHDYETDTLTTTNSMQNMFAETHVLFMPQVLSSVQVLRSMDVDFGIVPFPKFDSAQSDYRTPVQANVTAVAIPINVEDVDRTAVVTEMLAKYGHETVLPAYFDVALKTKYARDDDSAEMLDLIVSKSAYDFAYINSNEFSDINEIFHSAVVYGKDIASAYEAVREKNEIRLAELTEVGADR